MLLTSPLENVDISETKVESSARVLKLARLIRDAYQLILNGNFTQPFCALYCYTHPTE